MIFIFDITLLLPPQKPIFHNLSKRISLWSSFWKYKSKSFVEYSWNLMQCFSEFEDRRIWFLTSASIFILIYLNDKSNVSGLQLFKFFTWSYILQKETCRKDLWQKSYQRQKEISDLVDSHVMAKPLLPDNNGRTPIHMAAKNFMLTLSSFWFPSPPMPIL